MSSDDIIGGIAALFLVVIVGILLHNATRDDGYWIETVRTCSTTSYKCVKDTTGPTNEAVAFCETKEECNKICKEYIK